MFTFGSVLKVDLILTGSMVIMNQLLSMDMFWHLETFKKSVYFGKKLKVYFKECRESVREGLVKVRYVKMKMKQRKESMISDHFFWWWLWDGNEQQMNVKKRAVIWRDQFPSSVMWNDENKTHKEKHLEKDVKINQEIPFVDSCKSLLSCLPVERYQKYQNS